MFVMKRLLWKNHSRAQKQLLRNLRKVWSLGCEEEETMHGDSWQHQLPRTKHKTMKVDMMEIEIR